jgi:hypothetical protein
MNRKSGCGCGSSSSHSHKDCPPMQACDTAKTHGDFCTVGTAMNVGDVELPTILGQFNVNINVEADICLPSPAAEIKNIRKNVFLTQCKASPRFTGGTTTSTVDLFIEGYVHKNIQFSEGCDGYLRDFSVNVPFRCFQTVSTAPAPIPVCFSQKSNQVEEIREMDKHGMGSDRCAFGSRTFENFLQPIECKLINSVVNQMDFPKNFDRWGNFKEITEKMSVALLIRLSQLQHRTGVANGTLVIDCVD